MRAMMVSLFKTLFTTEKVTQVELREVDPKQKRFFSWPCTGESIVNNFEEINRLNSNIIDNDLQFFLMFPLTKIKEMFQILDGSFSFD